MATPLSREAFIAHDRGLTRRCNALCVSPAVRRYFAAISRLGDGVFWYTLMGVLSTTQGRTGWHCALHMAGISIVSLALYKALKRWTRRPRPFASGFGVQAWVAPLDEFSFPSGHTLHAVAFSCVALSYFPVLAWVLVPFTVSVALSRVVLGLHYPSDVLAATAIGGVLAAGSFWVLRLSALLA